MVLLGYFLAIVIGFVIGLIGVSGRILSISVFDYFISSDAVTAIALSLFFIGITFLAGYPRFMYPLKLVKAHRQFLPTLTRLAIVGIYIKIAVTKQKDDRKLKPIFGWPTSVMDDFIVIKNCFQKISSHKSLRKGSYDLNLIYMLRLIN